MKYFNKLFCYTSVKRRQLKTLTHVSLISVKIGSLAM